MSEPAPSPAIGHVPVLMNEVRSLLAPAPGQVVLDATAGRGGHACALAEAAGPGGQVVLMDLDADNLAFAAERVRATGVGKVHALHASFATAEYALARLGLRADVLLADLGFASNQMDAPARGLGFKGDGPLDMRLDASRGETAAQLLQRLPEEEIARTIFELGEDPFARRIARCIVQRRSREGMRTTADLVAAVRAAYGSRAQQSRVHPATRTFMAFRILVNDELGALGGLLDAIRRGAAATSTAGWLAVGARIGIISFHSLEDRQVKHVFADLERDGLATRLTRKPAVPQEAEIQGNPRARSAKLRALQLGVETRPNR